MPSLDALCCDWQQRAEEKEPGHSLWCIECSVHSIVIECIDEDPIRQLVATSSIIEIIRIVTLMLVPRTLHRFRCLTDQRPRRVASCFPVSINYVFNIGIETKRPMAPGEEALYKYPTSHDGYHPAVAGSGGLETPSLSLCL